MPDSSSSYELLTDLDSWVRCTHRNMNHSHLDFAYFFNTTPTIVKLRTVCFLFSSGLFNPMMAMSGALHPLLLGSQLSLANPLLASWLAGHQGGATVANSQDPSPAGFSSALVSRYKDNFFLLLLWKITIENKFKIYKELVADSQQWLYSS